MERENEIIPRPQSWGRSVGAVHARSWGREKVGGRGRNGVKDLYAAANLRAIYFSLVSPFLKKCTLSIKNDFNL